MKALLSIIIPTINEGTYLKRLLESIKNQTLAPDEIIVADAHSTDKTRDVAKAYGCKIVEGGHLPKARNNGAKVATGDILLLLDADGVLQKDFLEKTLPEFLEKKLGVASCFAKSEINSFTYNIGCFFTNFYYRIMQSFRIHVYGPCIFARREIHQKINGFDEETFVGEDQDYALRASKISKCRFLTSRKIILDMRRYEEEGKFKTTWKYLIIEFNMIFFGSVKKKIFRFEYGKHKDLQ